MGAFLSLFYLNNIFFPIYFIDRLPFPFSLLLSLHPPFLIYLLASTPPLSPFRKGEATCGLEQSMAVKLRQDQGPPLATILELIQQIDDAAWYIHLLSGLLVNLCLG